jgi:UDP-N-acetyl-L-fucosamine synthase
MKTLTVVGTRPELIRLSRLIPLLDETTDHTLVHTGQNYDYELNEIFFRDLGLRAPDRYLGVDTTSLGTVAGDVMRHTEDVLRDVNPDAFLVLGDTNSCLAAYIARRRGITVFHMEAGNRCWDINVPEETNRRLVDHISDINLCYTEHARRNLLREGLHPRSVYVTGSPMFEVLAAFRDQIDASDALNASGVSEGGYLLVSIHREENVDNRARFEQLIGSVIAVTEELDMQAVFSVHPRTRKRLDELPGLSSSRVLFAKPFGFHDYNRLQCGSYCVISDSGTISEESSILGFPAVTPRISIERPEAMDAGTIVLAGSSASEMRAAIDHARRTRNRFPAAPPEYLVPDFSHRVLGLVTGITPVRHTWDGLRR